MYHPSPPGPHDVTTPTHTFEVSKEQHAHALSSLVREALGVPWGAAKKLCLRGKVRVNGAAVTDPGHRVAAGSEVSVSPEGPSAARVDSPVLHLTRARLLHHDAHLVVVNKPPGISTVPFDETERDTLVDRLGVALHRWDLAPAHAPLFVVHRLDKETSGALVFGRTWLAKRHLADLFRRHAVDRVYLALVHGYIDREATIESMLLEDRGDGLRGSARGRTGAQGRKAVTHIKPVAQLTKEGGATLLEVRLETGRQHQIRIHLSERGHPLVGERVYIRRYEGAVIPAPRVMLHARTLGFTHPAHPEADPLRFECPPPDDFLEVARRLGLR